MTKDDAKKEMITHLNVLRESLKAFDENVATVTDFAVIGDKTMLFSESVADWIMCNDKRR